MARLEGIGYKRQNIDHGSNMTVATTGKGAVILIAGATASGKSEFAMLLAERIDGIVINADSMQVYRELRLITARPSPADEARVPHRLYGTRSAADPLSVGRWIELAVAQIDAAAAAGRVPIVVGGSGLYLSCLSEGLAEIPDIPGAVRAATRARYRALGPQRFHDALSARDEEMAARIGASDPQRLQRAWEVLEATGRSLADWQRDPPIRPLSGPWLGLRLERPRAELYRRCDARLDAILSAGALGEVIELAALKLSDELPLMRAVGVVELLAHVRGQVDLDDALAAAKTATRRYAKRQLTWLRNKMIAWNAINTQDSESIFEDFFPKISQFLLTAAK